MKKRWSGIGWTFVVLEFYEDLFKLAINIRQVQLKLLSKWRGTRNEITQYAWPLLEFCYRTIRSLSFGTQQKRRSDQLENCLKTKLCLKKLIFCDIHSVVKYIQRSIFSISFKFVMFKKSQQKSNVFFLNLAHWTNFLGNGLLHRKMKI